MKNSRVIEVRVKCAEPELASQVANRVVDRFVESNYAARYDAMLSASRWLDRQLNDIRKRAKGSQKTLLSYREKYGIVDVDDRQNTFSVREGELIHHHAQAQADRIHFEALLLGAQAFGASSLPQLREKSIVQELASKSAEVSVSLSQGLVSYGINHPEILKLKSQRVELNRLAEEEEGKILGQLVSSLRAAEVREKSLAEEVRREGSLLKRVSQYAILRREAQADEDLYNVLYARVREAGIAAGSKSSNIRVIERAIVPSKASWPNLLLMVPIGLVVACLGGVAAGVAREGMDDSVRSPEDVIIAGGGPRLVLLPETGRNGRRISDGASLRPQSSACQRGMEDIERFMLEQPSSAAAESIRALMGLILLPKQRNKARVLLIASPYPGEGKTTVAYNLALGLAEKGPTCFVDADLRKPNVDNVGGIFAHYRGAVTARDIETPSGDSPNLTYVGSGTGPENPVSVLISDKFQRFMSAIRSRYEFVVIDSPPLLPYADGRFLAAIADGVVLLSYAGVTGRRAMESAVEILTQFSVPILGVVLNGVRVVDIPYRTYR